MKLREYAPVYMNPTFDEVVELAKSGWDTIRIGVSEQDDLLLASGYGNTHETLAYYLHQQPGCKRSYMDCWILFHEQGIAYMNLCDVGGPDKARYERWSKTLNDKHVDILKDLIRESDLAL